MMTRASTLAFAGPAIAFVLLVACGAMESTTVGGPWTPPEGGTRDGTRSGSPSGSGSSEEEAFSRDAGVPDRVAACKPLTCADQGIECGPAGDGCGGLIADCGKCQAGLRCGAPGVLSKCAPYAGLGCALMSCQEQGVECGSTGDGCGGIIPSCGTCDAGLVCGISTAHSKCSTPIPEGWCTPRTCVEADAGCGRVADGCGGLTPSCGECAHDFSCKHGACVRACTPVTCTELGAQCGYVADGCGGVIDCGVCPDGFACGIGGRPYACVRGQP